MVAYRHDVQSFGDAVQVYAKHARVLPSLGYRAARLGHNTVLRLIGSENAYAVRYHGTDVVTYEPNGDITLDADGFITKTTAERMDAFTPQSVRVSYRYAGGDYRLLILLRGLNYAAIRTFSGPFTLRAAVL